ncbi:hypothetical protein GYMC10_3223 [Paenibacillus sp. Y412MC10]|nr:hypothetical protein GYMC10_3223 [Paenibacillus sp. Y412MC10]
MPLLLLLSNHTHKRPVSQVFFHSRLLIHGFYNNSLTKIFA